MILVGLLLIVLAVTGGTLLFIGTSNLREPVLVPVLNGTLGLPPLFLLLAGVLTVLLLWIGWALFVGGIRRWSRHRKESKAAAQVAEEARVAREREVQDGFAVQERQLAEERRQHGLEA